MNDKLLTNQVNRVNNLIKSLNISQSKFAKKLDISQAAVNNVLSGRNQPGTHFLRALEKAYPNVNIDWIVNGTGEMLINPDLPPDGGGAAANARPMGGVPNEAFQLLKDEIQKKDQTIQWLQNTVDRLVMSLGKFNPLDKSELAAIGEQFGGRMAA